MRRRLVHEYFGKFDLGGWDLSLGSHKRIYREVELISKIIFAILLAFAYSFDIGIF